MLAGGREEGERAAEEINGGAEVQVSLSKTHKVARIRNPSGRTNVCVSVDLPPLGSSCFALRRHFSFPFGLRPMKVAHVMFTPSNPSRVVLYLNLQLVMAGYCVINHLNYMDA